MEVQHDQDHQTIPYRRRSVIESIRARFDDERSLLLAAVAKVSIHQSRLDVLQQILNDAEKNGSDDAETTARSEDRTVNAEID